MSRLIECTRDHRIASSEERLLNAIFGKRENEPVYMELVIETPTYKQYKCPVCGMKYEEV